MKKQLLFIFFLLVCLGVKAQYQSENPVYMTAGSNVKFW